MDLVPLNLDYEIHCLLTARPCSRSLTTFMPLMWDLRKHRHSETRGKPSMLFLRHCRACFFEMGTLLVLDSVTYARLADKWIPETHLLLPWHRHCKFSPPWLLYWTHWRESSTIFSHSTKNVSCRTSPASEGACCQALGTWVQSPEPTQWKESTDLTSTRGVFLLPCSLTKRFCLFSEYLGISPNTFTSLCFHLNSLCQIVYLCNLNTF